MYFMLSQKEAKPGHWTQLGIVVADNLDAAVEQLGFRLVEQGENKAGIWADVVSGKEKQYSLESFSEIKGCFPD